MRDGFQLIARLPYPSTGPKHLATASEVATMDLVRNFGVPSPVVYGYSADSENPVGAEYILMEKVCGRCLGDVWFSLSDKQRVCILGEIVDQEVKLFDIQLPAYGSVFYPEDLPCHTDQARVNATNRRHCVGPDVSLKHWFGTRSRLDVPRVPSKLSCRFYVSSGTLTGHLDFTAQQVLESAARKEMAWLQEYGKHCLPFDREYRHVFGYQEQDPLEHHRLLQSFLHVIPEIVPEEDWLHRPTIRHPDLKQYLH